MCVYVCRVAGVSWTGRASVAWCRRGRSTEPKPASGNWTRRHEIVSIRRHSVNREGYSLSNLGGMREARRPRERHERVCGRVMPEDVVVTSSPKSFPARAHPLPTSKRPPTRTDCTPQRQTEWTHDHEQKVIRSPNVDYCTRHMWEWLASSQRGGRTRGCDLAGFPQSSSPARPSCGPTRH